jgi:hypothetical protein
MAEYRHIEGGPDRLPGTQVAVGAPVAGPPVMPIDAVPVRPMNSRCSGRVRTGWPAVVLAAGLAHGGCTPDVVQATDATSD